MENSVRGRSYRVEEQRRPVFARRICIKKTRFNSCQINSGPIWQSKWCTTKGTQLGGKNKVRSAADPKHAYSPECQYQGSLFQNKSCPCLQTPAIVLMDYDTRTHSQSHRAQQISDHSSLSAYYGCESKSSFLIDCISFQDVEKSIQENQLQWDIL